MFEAVDLAILQALYAAGQASAWLEVVKFVTFLGSGWMLIGLAPVVFRRDLREFALTLLVTIAATSGIVASIKAMTGRVRPCHALDWVHPILAAVPTDPSFPSGHAAGSFACAAFLLAKHRRLGIALFALAIAVAASRVALGVHYPSDVMAGALLGSMVGAVGARIPSRYAASSREPVVQASSLVEARSVERSAAVDLADADPKAVR
jgi:undecaprenyl-diphosphatase